MAGTVKENLIAAKALIADPAKWTKGKYIDGEGCMCAAGAVRQVTGEKFGEAESCLDRVVCEAFYEEFGFDIIEDFNDDPETTHADIMVLFQRAIDAQDGAL